MFGDKEDGLGPLCPHAWEFRGFRDVWDFEGSGVRGFGRSRVQLYSNGSVASATALVTVSARVPMKPIPMKPGIFLMGPCNTV